MSQNKLAIRRSDRFAGDRANEDQERRPAPPLSIRRVNNRPPLPADLTILERIPWERLEMVIQGQTQTLCDEGAAFEALCDDVIVDLGPRPSAKHITQAKALLLDRYCFVMGILPPSHFVNIFGFPCLLHSCLPDVLQEAHDKINRLAARTNADVPGFPLGFQQHNPQE